MKGTIISTIYKLLGKTDNLQAQIDALPEPTVDEWTLQTLQGYADTLELYKNSKQVVIQNAVKIVRADTSGYGGLIWSGAPKPPKDIQFPFVYETSSGSKGYSTMTLNTNGSIKTDVNLTNNTKVYFNLSYYHV